MKNLKSIACAGLLGLASLAQSIGQENTNACSLLVRITEEYTKKGIELRLADVTISHTLEKDLKPYGVEVFDNEKIRQSKRVIPLDEGYLVETLDGNTNVLESTYAISRIKEHIKVQNPELKTVRYQSINIFTNNPAIKFVRISDSESHTTNKFRVSIVETYCLDHYKTKN